MNRRGFTVVELIITITIMGILLLLTVVNVNSTQVNARDSERTGDIGTIASYLEGYFKVGGTTGGTVGRYPTTYLATAGDFNVISQVLPGIEQKNLIPPGGTTLAASFVAATNTSQTVNGITPQPTTGQFVYQPLLPTGALCSGTSGTEDCRKFNLYYRLEKDNAVYMVTSKNQ